MLDLWARPCLVVGGGAIAERKVEGLVEGGARVTVVSPSLTHSLLRLAAARARVMVATDDASVNTAVAAECRERGILINCADDPARCDFILPSVLKRGALTVAVSTGGTSPTMARLVR